MSHPRHFPFRCTYIFCRFEAAWEGKNDKIKELTLANWGLESKNKPLQVSTEDCKGFTPFAIAMYRRHFESAKLLLGIADAQFKEPDKSKTKKRYVIAGEDDADNSTDEDSDALNISAEVVDETYTYDNVAALQDSVGSTVSGKSLLIIDARYLDAMTSTNISPAAGILVKHAEIWWFLDKPEREAMTMVGQSRFSDQGSCCEGRSASVGWTPKKVAL